MVKQKHPRMVSKPDVIYMDDDLLVVNKPSGMLSIPDGYNPEKPYLQSLLEPHYGKLWIIHRLDMSTSGIVILARNKEAHRHLNNQFSRHLVEKIYWAIIVGVPIWEKIEVNEPLRSNVGRRKRTIIDEKNGKPARTSFCILRRYEEYALVEARPLTGRTHQIRAHLYSIGHPILADPLYGDVNETPLIDRLALHARCISFIHPTSAEKVTFQVPEGEDLTNTLKFLTEVSTSRSRWGE